MLGGFLLFIIHFIIFGCNSNCIELQTVNLNTLIYPENMQDIIQSSYQKDIYLPDHNYHLNYLTVSNNLLSLVGDLNNEIIPISSNKDISVINLNNATLNISKIRIWITKCYSFLNISKNSKSYLNEITFCGILHDFPSLILMGGEVFLKNIDMQFDSSSDIVGLITCGCSGGSISFESSNFKDFSVKGTEPFIGSIRATSTKLSSCSFSNITTSSHFKFSSYQPDFTSISSSSFKNCHNVFYGTIIQGIQSKKFNSFNNTYSHSLTFFSSSSLSSSSYSLSSTTYNETQIIEEEGDSSFSSDEFTDCQGTGNGGAIRKAASGSLSLSSCVFSNCSSSSSNETNAHGGAVYACQSQTSEDPGTFSFSCDSCQFKKCRVRGEGAVGGALYVCGKVSVTGGSSESCMARAGGAMCVLSVSGESMIQGHAFKDNRAAVVDDNETNSSSSSYSSSSYSSSSFFSSLSSSSSSSFSSNEGSALARGGAVVIGTVLESLRFLSCSFKDNKAKYSGGACYIGLSQTNTSEEAKKIVNFEWVTFSNNNVEEQDPSTEEPAGNDVEFSKDYVGLITRDNFPNCESSSDKPRVYVETEGSHDEIIQTVHPIKIIIAIITIVVALGFIIPLWIIGCCFCMRCGCYKYRKDDPLYIHNQQIKQQQQLLQQQQIIQQSQIQQPPQQQQGQQQQQSQTVQQSQTGFGNEQQNTSSLQSQSQPNSLTNQPLTSLSSQNGFNDNFALESQNA